MARLLGQAARTLAFMIGDWLVYGDDLFGVDSPPNRHISAALYEKAATQTGLDIPTLQIYAFVSRRVPYRLRSERLSWEHHKVLAKMSMISGRAISVIPMRTLARPGICWAMSRPIKSTRDWMPHWSVTWRTGSG